jgi:flagellar protein FliS
MQTTTRAMHAYYQTQVQTQSPLELVVLLYDGALRYMQMASDALRRQDLVAKREGMRRSVAFVAELQNTLNLTEGGEIAKSLDALYGYIAGRLTDANMRRDPAPVDEAIRLLKPLRDAWAKLAMPSAANQTGAPW